MDQRTEPQSPKHTPGPWVAQGTAVMKLHDLLGAATADENAEQAEANVRLIAAAPDLLAALRDALEFIGLCDEDTIYAAREAGVFDTGEAAIAKAES